jgi:hypothetical protein
MGVFPMRAPSLVSMLEQKALLHNEDGRFARLGWVDRWNGLARFYVDGIYSMFWIVNKLFPGGEA